MMDHVYHQSELRKLTNKIGFKEAQKALMVKWSEVFRQYFNK